MKHNEMKHLSIYLAASLIIVAFITGAAGGYFISPQYARNMESNTEEMGLGKADKNLDLRYIDQMIAHHRGAILLAEQAERNTTRQEIHTLTEDIKENEPKLIQELYDWKKEWYQDTEKVEDPEAVNLGGKDDKADLRFLNALISHHEAGIEMTREVRAKSTRSEILNNADAVENFLSQSLLTLKGWRMDWYFVR
jgi:uncharacterized protein (DUF305 family)